MHAGQRHENGDVKGQGNREPKQEQMDPPLAKMPPAFLGQFGHSLTQGGLY